MADLDASAERNVKLKATMRQNETPLSRNGGAGQVVCPPKFKGTVTKTSQRGSPHK